MTSSPISIRRCGHKLFLMRLFLGSPPRICALLLAAAALARAADPVVEDLFRKARDKVLDNARRMPRYTCVENISRAQYQPSRGRKPSSCPSIIAARRNLKSPGELVWRDRLRLDVAVVDGGEMFSWAGAGKFETHDLDRLVGGGASGSGDFGSFLAGVFGNETDAVRYLGLQNSLALFEYNVPIEKSSYRYHTNGPEKKIGFGGTFSLDPSNADVEQLVVATDQFAPGDAACRVEHVMNYQRVKIGDGDFLLPEVSAMNVVYQAGAESRNETHYSDCREYVGESTIRFDEVDPAAAPATAKAGLQPLPPKVRLRIGLSKPIDLANTAAGDEVTGIVLQANERVHGRILRLRQYLSPLPRWVIAIRFDTIERGGFEQPITLKPLDDGDRPARFRGPMLPRSVTERPEGAGVFIFSERNLVLDQKFQSEWETL
jgi:hypothetical protein